MFLSGLGANILPKTKFNNCRLWPFCFRSLKKSSRMPSWHPPDSDSGMVQDDETTIKVHNDANACFFRIPLDYCVHTMSRRSVELASRSIQVMIPWIRSVELASRSIQVMIPWIRSVELASRSIQVMIPWIQRSIFISVLFNGCLSFFLMAKHSAP